MVTKATNNELMLDVGQANELKLAFRRAGWTNEHIKALTEQKALLAQVLGMLEGRPAISATDPEILPEIITVDYSMSLDDMIRAGNYDWKHGRLTAKRFPIKGEGKIDLEVKLFNFGFYISSRDAKRSIEEHGWFPAQTEHLLAYGAKNPEADCRFWIVALGSVGRVYFRRMVPLLQKQTGFDSKRFLRLGFWKAELEWPHDCRFLAVRPVTRASGP